MSLDDTGLDSALSALAEQLKAAAAEPIELVVCGGSALQALGLIDRATKDVDVLAIAYREHGGELDLISAEPLPEVMVELAALVARDLALPRDWLNPGPTDLLTHGLPEGLVGRLVSRRYGPGLLIHFIGRFDQICLKTYAVVNGGGARHLSDLTALKPSKEEMLSAARWCLTQDASEVFPMIVRSFLEQTGYADVAERLGTTNKE